MYSYSLYARRDTVIQNLNPVTKVVLPFSLMGLTIFVSSPVWNFLILLVTLGVVLLAKIPLSTLKPYVKIILVLSVVFSLNWLIFGKKGGLVIVTIGWLQITESSLNATLTSILRLIILILSSVIFMGIMSESELIEGFRKLKLPYVVCFIFMMAIRFFPTLAMDMTTIREAQMSRGTEFEKGSLLERGKKFVAILIPLVVVSFRRVEVIGIGLEARAFTPGLTSSKRTFFRESTLRKRDVALITIAVAVLFGVIIYPFLSGILGVASTANIAG